MIKDQYGRLRRNLSSEYEKDNLNLPFVSLSDFNPDLQLQKRISEKYAKKNQVVVLEEDNHSLKMAIANPSHEKIYELMNAYSSRKKKLELVLAKSNEVNSCLEKFYLNPENSSSIVRTYSEDDKRDYLNSVIGNGPVSVDTIYLTERIVSKAIDVGASDIHLQSTKDGGKLRYRVDGILHEIDLGEKLRRNFHSVVSRFKVLTKSMITYEKVIPQGGSFSTDYNHGGIEKRIDFRAETGLSLYGENMSLRVLDQSKADISLFDLGFSNKFLDSYLDLIKKSEGMILVTGPTGTGKSTTLYATLNKLVSPEKNILTAEDPIEYRFESGITQHEVHRAKNVGFSELLKSFLRSDPDVIMVGEIRDEETAGMALRAVQTGHLLLSTLHTMNSTSAVNRISKLNIEPNNFLSHTSGIIGQRLVRTVCSSCVQDYYPSPVELEKYFGSPNLIDLPFVKGTGCDDCNFEGYKGRTSVNELWIPTKVRYEGDPLKLRKGAIENGFEPFFIDGIRKLKSKQTTLDELLRVVPNIKEDRDLIDKSKIKKLLR